MPIGKAWTAAEDKVFDAYQALTAAQLLQLLPNRALHAIRVRAWKLGKSRKYALLSEKEYLAMLSVACSAHRVNYGLVLNGSRKRAACRVRWEVWSKLHKRGCSLQNIARVANVDNSTVHYGIAKVGK